MGWTNGRTGFQGGLGPRNVRVVPPVSRPRSVDSLRGTGHWCAQGRQLSQSPHYGYRRTNDVTADTGTGPGGRTYPRCASVQRFGFELKRPLSPRVTESLVSEERSTNRPPTPQRFSGRLSPWTDLPGSFSKVRPDLPSLRRRELRKPPGSNSFHYVQCFSINPHFRPQTNKK